MLQLVLLWILVAWCGTPWPRRWPFPPPTPPDPWFMKGINIVGGVIGGWVFNQVWTMSEPMTGIAAAATGLGAFLGAVVLGDVMGLVVNRPAIRHVNRQQG